jgi:hypothetical protein
MTLNSESWDFISRHIDCPASAPLLLKAATYWLLWNKKAEEISTWRYRIEDFSGSIAQEICYRMNIYFSRDAVISIPCNFNTRREGRVTHVFEEFFLRGGLNVPRSIRAIVARPVSRERLNWGLLENADPVLCARIRVKATEYGYIPSESK